MSTKRTVDVFGCSACGGDHFGLKFYALEINDPNDFTYWGQCPLLAVPVLMRDVDSTYSPLPELQVQVQAFREAMWLAHGHTNLYGDDGEMQCGYCGVDYKKDHFETVIRAFTRSLQTQVAMLNQERDLVVGLLELERSKNT